MLTVRVKRIGLQPASKVILQAVVEVRFIPALAQTMHGIVLIAGPGREHWKWDFDGTSERL